MAPAPRTPDSGGQQPPAFGQPPFPYPIEFQNPNEVFPPDALEQQGGQVPFGQPMEGQRPGAQSPWESLLPDSDETGFSLPQSGDERGTGGTLNPSQEGEEAPAAKKRLTSKMILILLAILAVLFFLRYQVFVVKRVNVSGTSAEIWQSVAKEAGLDRGMFFFSVNEDRIRQAVESNRYLIFDSMEKMFPGTVNIKVTQRKPFAFFTHLGVGYVLAGDGMILEQTRELSVGDHLMKVIGLSVWGQQSPGSLPSSTDPTQAETLLELFSELSAWGFESQVNTVDVAESLHINLQTIDGYSINLGSSEQLHAKLGTVASVVNELRRRQMFGGIIEATRPGEASYLAGQ